MSPYTPAGNTASQPGLAADNADGPRVPSASGAPSDPKPPVGEPQVPVLNQINSNSSAGHLVSDTPLHSVEDGKTKDGEREATANTDDKANNAEKVAGNSNKKRRVSKPPARIVSDERSNGGRRSMGSARVTVDLTKEEGLGNKTKASKPEKNEQEKKTPNQMQKSIERYLTLSNKQGSNQSVEDGLTHTSKEKSGLGKSKQEAVDEKKRERKQGHPKSEGNEVGATSVEKNKVMQLEKQAASLKEENEHLQDQLKKTQAACDALEEQMKHGSGSRSGASDASRLLDQQRLSFVVELAKEHALMYREIRTRQLQEDAPRLGTLSVQRKGIEVQEVWENGAAILKLGESYKNLQKQREQIDALRKATKRRLPLPGQPVPPRMDETVESISETGPIHPDDWLMQEEVSTIFHHKVSWLVELLDVPFFGLQAMSKPRILTLSYRFPSTGTQGTTCRHQTGGGRAES